jgi:hypothetical protein
MGSNPTFRGALAMKEYGKLRGVASAPVPVESKGGEGTRDSHWRDTLFVNELMTGYVSDPPNPMSRMTVASLGDMGYVVDLERAEKYKLPDHLVMAESGNARAARPRRARHDAAQHPDGAARGQPRLT